MLNFSLGQIEYRGVSDESKEKTFFVMLRCFALKILKSQYCKVKLCDALFLSQLNMELPYFYLCFI